jgi:hypothetical protein
MAVAATCVTGLFYKLGHGMLGTLAGLAAWAIGDIITYRGTLSSVRDTLNAAQVTVKGESATIINLLGPAGVILVAGLGALVIIALWGAPRRARGKLWGWFPLGLALGVITTVAWLLARAGGSHYSFGTSSIPTGIVGALSGEETGGSPWIPVALISLVPGAFVAAWGSGTLLVRGETVRRYAQLAAGSLLMGIGAGIAGGCNLGHSLVGVPLLSLGSITTTLSMAAGVFLADRFLKVWPAS